MTERDLANATEMMEQFMEMQRLLEDILHAEPISVETAERAIRVLSKATGVQYKLIVVREREG